jgi:hypothetical protein
MLILQALLLWLIVSALMVGGAMLFHRFFPDESPWFGFLVPPLALVVLINFIEHLIALPSLLILLPAFLAGTVWMGVAGKCFKPALILPTALFLGVFAFTFLIRCLQADISYTSDGVSDLNMINNFLQGQTVPPPDTWLPPLRFEWYYDLQHYAASVLGRLLNVDIGHADNVSHALLNALVCVTAAGAAHRLSGEKLFATLALPFLILSAATGSAAYLILVCHNLDPWLAADLSSGMVRPPDANPIWPWLAHDLPTVLQGKSPDDILAHQTLRLQVPGFWTWRDEYHANAAGHLLTILSVLVVAELANPRRTTWPWVLAAIMPMLAATASAWALPITGLLCWVMLPVAWILGRRPGAINVTLWTLFASVTLLWPAFYNVTSSPLVPDVNWIDPLDRVPLREFIAQWWPIALLWIGGLCCWRSLSFGARWFLVVAPLMLVGIDMVTIESRYNTIEKMWGYTWALGLAGLFPIICWRAGGGGAFRIITILLLANASVSLGNFFYSACGNGAWDGSLFHLEGDRYITNDDQKKRMLDVARQFKRAVFLSGKCAYCYNEAPALAVFTGNLTYSAWSWFEVHASDATEAKAREKLNNDFYDGTMTDRLDFLRSKQIAGVLVWPDDTISDDALAALKKDLAPDYDYVDCKGTGANNAGVFVRKQR